MTLLSEVIYYILYNIIKLNYEQKPISLNKTLLKCIIAISF